MIKQDIRQALIKAYNEFGQEVVTQLINKLRSLDKVASGRLINSLNYKLRETLDGVEIDFEAEDYIKWVDEGRRPGKFAPINPIKKWCKTRGLNENVAYAINYKIKRVGITPTRFIDEVFNDSKIQSLTNKIEDLTSQAIEKNIK